MSGSNSIKCRKCGGPHLTIKCGKEPTNKPEPVKLIKPDYAPKNNKVYKIKITNLPLDVTFNEVNNFIKDWGHVNKLNIKYYDTSAMAVIEFKFEDESEYFIKALNKTPFGYSIIYVDKLESYIE